MLHTQRILKKMKSERLFLTNKDDEPRWCIRMVREDGRQIWTGLFKTGLRLVLLSNLHQFPHVLTMPRIFLDWYKHCRYLYMLCIILIIISTCSASYFRCCHVTYHLRTILQIRWLQDVASFKKEDCGTARLATSRKCHIVWTVPGTLMSTTVTSLRSSH